MAPTLGRLRLGISLAIVMVGVVGLSSPIGASPSPNPGTAIGTPLPPGWELCILQGVGAPGTQDDVANLDEWQVVEGGSTNNAAAFNPFNTRQATDSQGTPLPVVASMDGFPAFTTWTAGCAATVAALLQPSMAPIVTALKAGDVSVPGIFLSDVDQTPWCAPSVDGIPCYASEILAGELVATLLNGSAGQLQGALTSYSSIGTDLHSYEEESSSITVDQELLAARNEQLALTEHEVSEAQRTLSGATGALRGLAIDDYTNDAVVRSDATLQLFSPPDDQDIATQFFRSVASSLLTFHYDQAESTVKASISKRQTAETSVAQATSLLDAATASENQALSGLEADVKAVEVGLACTAQPLVTAAASSVGGQVGGQGSVSLLWTALQDCLAPPAQLGAPIVGSPPA